MTRPGLVFVHPSDELYGADRMLLQMHAALDPEIAQQAEFWLPNDIEHPADPLCSLLESRGTRVRHLDLPVLRRAYRTPTQLFRLARRAQRLHRELRRAQPQVVYCTTSASFVAAPIAAAAGVPHVVGHVQEFWSRSDAVLLAQLARPLEHVLAISDAVAESLPERVRARTRVVLNGTPDPGPGAELDTHSGPLRYLVASRWNGWKGHRTLLAAWDRLENPGHLVVLGGAPASGDRVDVPGLVAGLRRPETVTVVGEVHDTAEHVEQADVVIVPSDQPEPFGLVAVEAFGRGRPVIGSRAGGLEGIVTHGYDGWLFPAGDSEALATLISRLGRADVTAAGKRARASYENRFTFERFAEDWRKALDLPLL